MEIFLKKFGKTLVSRDLGKEAFAAFASALKDVSEDEKIVVDFEGVSVFTPSWADEFLTLLRERYGDRVEYINTENPSVKATLELLEDIEKETV